MSRSTSPSSSGLALVAARYELVRELRVDAETVDWEAVDTTLDRPVLVRLLRVELVNDPAARDRFWQQASAAARRTAMVGDRVLDGGTNGETGQPFIVREWPVAPPSAANLRRSIPREASLIAQLRNRLDGSPRWLLVGAALILIAFVFRPVINGWLAWVNEPFARADRGLTLPAVGAAPPASGAQPGRGTSTAATAPPTVAPAAARATPPATRVATVTPLTRGQIRQIVNTDGRGVALRTGPGGERQPGKGYDEGVTVEALEESGEWTLIRGSDGREGWVLSVTLAP
jgi:hypothetical protein